MKLNDGNSIPQLGFGTFKLKGKQGREALKYALEVGYRSFDTASFYENEEDVGKVLDKTDIKREELFITTKIWNSEQQKGGAKKALKRSLSKLKLDYVDLYLIHWPVKGEYTNTWEEMIKLKEKGLIKSIGVSNFNIRHIEKLLNETDIIPVVNQIEFHPYMVQGELKDYCESKNIIIESWAPLGSSKSFDEDIIKELSKKYKKTSAQIILRWHLDKKNIVIPKSKTPKRIKENYDINDFKLNEDEISAIDSLNKNLRIGPNPENVNF